MVLVWFNRLIVRESFYEKPILRPSVSSTSESAAKRAKDHARAMPGRKTMRKQKAKTRPNQSQHPATQDALDIPQRS